MIKAGIIGATGFTGFELIRLILRHPKMQLTLITSRTEEGVAVAKWFPQLKGECALTFQLPDLALISQCDVLFFATPHAVSMHSMAAILATGIRVIDLSADFRLKDIAVWEHWYGCKHTYPEGVDSAVYGLPELNQTQLKNAQLVAAPGCYPTAIQLALIPLLEKALIEPTGIVCNAASGVTGAGRTAKVEYGYTACNEDFRPYAAQGHRHLPEIKQGLTTVAGKPVELTFVPHLLPLNRGILATIYADVKEKDGTDWQQIFQQRYDNSPFVQILEQGELPSLSQVKGTNYCRIAVSRPIESNKIVIFSAIDNLVKGASGQAIQIMNIMFDLDQKLGLNHIAIAP